jgi:hypothetical protein
VIDDRFDDLVEGLEPEEQERLRAVHELLFEAGPPPELSLRLATLPAGVTDAPPPPRSPLKARRSRGGWRLAGALAFAAVALAAVFGGGYAIGHGHATPPQTVRVATMIGSNAVALLRVLRPDEAGNVPIDFSVKGLPDQTSPFAYYEVFVVFHDHPTYPCGGFRVADGKANVRFWVPYEVNGSTEWVVKAIDRGNPWPGRTVMTMA